MPPHVVVVVATTTIPFAALVSMADVIAPVYLAVAVAAAARGMVLTFPFRLSITEKQESEF